jgi:hypothetical protein
MYTQHSKFTGRADAPFIPLTDKDPPPKTVKLLQQTGAGKVVYIDADGVEETAPSHEFFGAFRDATQAEIEGYGKAPEHKPGK